MPPAANCGIIAMVAFKACKVIETDLNINSIIIVRIHHNNCNNIVDVDSLILVDETSNDDGTKK